MVNFLKNPLTLVFAFAIAILMSVYSPTVARSLEIPANMYLSVLQMCILPLLMCSLVKSCSAIVGDRSSSSQSNALLIKLTILSFILIVIVMLITSIIPVGYHMEKSGELVKFATFENGLTPIYTTMTEPVMTNTSIMEIIQTIFTRNIFESLSKSMMMQIIFFSIMVGCSAGWLSGSQKDVFNHLVSSLENVFKRIIGWVMLILPIGVLCMFAFNFQKISKDIVGFMLPFVLFIVIGMFATMAVFHFLLSKRLGKGFVELYRDLKAPLIIAFSTSSVLSCLPSFIQALNQNIKIDEKDINLYGPLTLALYRYGAIFYYTFSTIVLGQLFSVPFGWNDYVMIGFLSFCLSFAAVSNGIINISLMALILSPVNIPSALPLTLLIAVDPLIDPIRTTFTVYMGAYGLSNALASKHAVGKS